ncbi:hypothetical protein DRN38_00155 [Thermococci archaeon]|nr:MAG: hypothetical protein DRN38_00155 [Thermococci archaeon]
MGIYMVKNIPVISWRFGDEYYITEFIKPNTYMVEYVAEKLKGKDNVETVLNIAKFIRDNFYYPLDSRGNPSTDGQFLKSKRTMFSYHFKKCVQYMWLFPSEVLNMGFGICIDTSVLAVSLMRKLNIDSWCVLGAVYNANGDLLGYHAWAEFLINNEWFILETTIHEKGTANIIKRFDGYSGKYGIRYEPFAKFNEREYFEIKSLVPLFNFYGMSKKIIKRLEKRKQKEIWNTYKEVTPLIKSILKRG